MFTTIDDNTTDEKALVCIYCRSTQVIRHGKTSTGNKRYRCCDCGRTWVYARKRVNRPPVSILVEEYLTGKTCRDLVEMYHSSPLKINQKIREFLEGVPEWEDYLDCVVTNHNYRLIYLIGKSFACSCEGASNNTMFFAMAVDALSNVVLGYQVGKRDNFDTWIELLKRMRSRGIKSASFMTNGSRHMEEAVNIVYKNATLRIFYHKVYRDKELDCCQSRFTINNKLINDAVKAYDIIDNHTLNNYLMLHYGKNIKDYIVKYSGLFSERLRHRLDNKQKIRIDGLINSFKSRFEKFHMLKGNPRPMINGWIAKVMTENIFDGYSRLSLLLQIPAKITFQDFACGNKPQETILATNSPELKNFAIEIAVRAVHLPIFYSRCEMKIDKCSLI
jgi:transposase-like protein